MKQTSTLKLNLIEGTDQVDWVPLNDNMEKLETETTAIRTSLNSSTSEFQTKLTTESADIRAILTTETGDLWDALDDKEEELRDKITEESANIRSILTTETGDLWDSLEDDMDTVNQQISDLESNLGSIGTNARIVWGTQTLTGTSTTFTFDFKPMLIFFARTDGSYNSVAILIRGCNGVYATEAPISSVTWAEKSVTFTATGELGPNTSTTKDVIYAAIGVDE
jgi:hypothetical protein